MEKLSKSNKSRKNRGKRNNKVSLNRVISEVNHYAISLIAPIDTIGSTQYWDINTMFLADTQYANLQEIYASFSYQRLEIEFHSTNPNSVTTTDQELAVFGIQEGIYATSAKTYTSVVNLPTSFWLNNVDEKLFKYDIQDKSYFPSSLANASGNLVPKINLFYGAYVSSTTGSIMPIMVVRLFLNCKDKIN